MSEYEEIKCGTGNLWVKIEVCNLEPGQEAECEYLLRSDGWALEDRMREEDQ